MHCVPTTHDQTIPLPSGTFLMGSNDHYREEAPQRQVTVDGFTIDAFELTNCQFARFVETTGYATTAELGTGEAGPFGEPGAAVFVGVNQVGEAWWRWTPGASWRAPKGPTSDLEGRADHPVVHLTHQDVLAYADWAGKRLPTEAEWEYAARGGLEGATYSWGEAPASEDEPRANHWQGLFPFQDVGTDGYRGTAPVGQFPPNGYGLYDATGNVWEMTGDTIEDGLPAQIIKGGSYLCADNFCRRYRPAAKDSQEHGIGASHVGIRLVSDP
ncbi:MAG: formylglycine-generating enzyme family protein [Pseudomonadota bacterium]